MGSCFRLVSLVLIPVTVDMRCIKCRRGHMLVCTTWMIDDVRDVSSTTVLFWLLAKTDTEAPIHPSPQP